MREQPPRSFILMLYLKPVNRSEMVAYSMELNSFDQHLHYSLITWIELESAFVSITSSSCYEQKHGQRQRQMHDIDNDIMLQRSNQIILQNVATVPVLLLKSMDMDQEDSTNV